MSAEGNDKSENPTALKVADPLQMAVEAYSAQLHRGTKASDDEVNLEGLSRLSAVEVSNLIRQTPDVERDIFGHFSFAKHALELCIRNKIVKDFNDCVARWLHACVEAGAFRECIRYASAIVDSDVWGMGLLSSQRLQILFYVAKSFRNIGRYEEAKRYYRMILEMAESSGETVEISIGLLLIGKLYGNYLGQRSLFSCFIEEAKRRLENELKHNRSADLDQVRVKRGIAICHDALGQAYRDSGDSASKVQNHFIKAININREIKRRNGVSRASCHINLFGFTRASSLQEKRKYLGGFKEGMDLLLLIPQDEKGIGVRFLQYSMMLAEIGEGEKAREHHAYGKLLVEKYSEYKMQAYAAIVEYDLYKDLDMERAVNSLKRGSKVAQQYNLIIQENEINRRLAETSYQFMAVPSADIPELIESNRLNLGKLLTEVKGSFSHLNSGGDLQPEFKHLSEEAKRGVPEKLLLDYDHTVKQLDRDMQILITLLKKASPEAR
jgi:tetratricopeptide (TPR) repeat protein